VKRRRRLRSLAADERLIRRRAAGVPLRELAADYGVAHTTLGRYFARPEVKRQLTRAGQRLRAEQRVLAARRSVERRLEQEVRRRADEQVAAEREQRDGYRAALAAWRSRRRRAGGQLAGWPQDREPPRLPLRTRAERHSTYDKEAEQVVAAGGGIEAVIAVTDLCTLENAVRHVDPVILRQAFDNDALERAQPRPPALKHGPRLRRLLPDAELIRRRAAGEPLRTLARDYHVAHTTLARYFARPEIHKQLRHSAQQLRAEQRAQTGRRYAARQVKPEQRPQPAAEQQARHARPPRPSN
jgi:lambda repressor-like predicted transcriptional regulator